MTVMGTTGVVGQVMSTDARTARCACSPTRNSGAAAIIQSNRARGHRARLARAACCTWRTVDADVVVNVGDVIVTSGLGGSYARGLIIGTVVRVEPRQGDATRPHRGVAQRHGRVALEVLVVRVRELEGALGSRRRRPARCSRARQRDTSGNGDGEGGGSVNVTRDGMRLRWAPSSRCSCRSSWPRTSRCSAHAELRAGLRAGRGHRAPDGGRPGAAVRPGPRVRPGGHAARWAAMALPAGAHDVFGLARVLGARQRHAVHAARHLRGVPRCSSSFSTRAFLHGARASMPAPSTCSCTARCRARCTTAWWASCSTRLPRASLRGARAGRSPARRACAREAAHDRRPNRSRRRRSWRPSPSSSRSFRRAQPHEDPVRQRRRRTCARWATWACPRRWAARASARAAAPRRA